MTSEMLAEALRKLREAVKLIREKQYDDAVLLIEDARSLIKAVLRWGCRG